MVKLLPIIKDIDAVQRLRKLLVINYTLPPAAAGIFFLGQHVLTLLKISDPLFVILIFTAVSPPVLVTPFIFYVLYREKRYGWLTSYFIMVIIPVILFFIIFQDSLEYMIWMPVYYMVPFYFYSFIIKFSVDEWIREYYWNQQLLEQRKESEEKKKELL